MMHYNNNIELTVTLEYFEVAVKHVKMYLQISFFAIFIMCCRGTKETLTSKLAAIKVQTNVLNVVPVGNAGDDRLIHELAALGHLLNPVLFSLRP